MYNFFGVSMFKMFLFISLFMILLYTQTQASGPMGRNFGFGIIFGDPFGATINYWLSKENSVDAYIGASYFGGLRIGGDYLFHFDAFNSQVVKMYAGPGVVIGFGRGRGIIYKENKKRFYYWEKDEVGIATRVIFGVNFIPRRAPLEIFLEAGPLIGITPAVGVNLDASIGIRFYP